MKIENSPPWNLYSVFAALVIGYILCPLFFSNVLLLLDPFLVEGAPQMALQQTSTILSWGGIFAFFHWHYGHFGECIGWIRPPRHSLLRESIWMTLIMLALSLLMRQLWSLTKINDPVPYGHMTGDEKMILAIFAIGVAPVLEEVVFRGFIQSTFHKVVSPRWSILLTGLVFMVLHASYFDNLIALSHVMILGLLLGFWRERTGSLLPGMIAHCCNNALASVGLLLT